MSLRMQEPLFGVDFWGPWITQHSSPSIVRDLSHSRITLAGSVQREVPPSHSALQNLPEGTLWLLTQKNNPPKMGFHFTG